MNKIPQLRFPEFKEEWETKPLLELTENGLSNGAFNDPKKVGSGYRIINVKDMYVDGTINAENLTRVAIDEKEFSKNRVEFGDIFFTRSSLVKEGIAHSNVNLTNFNDLTFDGHLIRMRPKKEIYSPVFLYYNFSTPNVRIQFIQRGKTTTMTTIGQDDIATVEIIFPALSEQIKIANFFTIIDQKLQALKKKKTLLENYKKGIMQKIFNQEIRFKDDNGNDFPDWEMKRLGDFLVERSEFTNENLPLYSLTIEDGIVPKSERYERSFLVNDIESAYKVMEKDDFAFNPMNLRLGALARHKDDKRVLVSKYYNIFYCNEKVSTEFMELYLTSHDMIQYYNKMATGSLIEKKRVHYLDFVNFMRSLPSLQEQKKIAKFINEIDTKINYTANQVNKHEIWKKGLLQKMFV